MTLRSHKFTKKHVRLVETGLGMSWAKQTNKTHPVITMQKHFQNKLTKNIEVESFPDILVT